MNNYFLSFLAHLHVFFSFFSLLKKRRASSFKAYDNQETLASFIYYLHYLYVFTPPIQLQPRLRLLRRLCPPTPARQREHNNEFCQGSEQQKDVHVLACGPVCMHVWNDSCITELIEDMWSGEALGETPFTSIQSKNMEFGEILAGAHSVINALPLSQASSAHARARTHTHTQHRFYNDIYCFGSGAQWRRRLAGLPRLSLRGRSAVTRSPFQHIPTSWGGAGFARRSPLPGS